MDMPEHRPEGTFDDTPSPAASAVPEVWHDTLQDLFGGVEHPHG